MNSLNMKRLLLVAIALVLVGGVGSAASFSAMDRDAIEQSETIDAANISAVEVRTDNGKVLMRGTDGSQIRVELTGEAWGGHDAELRVAEKDGTLRIETSDTDQEWFDFFPGVQDLRIAVYVPNDKLQLVKANLQNGKFEAESLQAQRFEVSTSNGKISAKDVAADTVDVETSNGSIRMEHVTGDVIGETSNGSITLITEDMERNVDLQTSNGSIKIETDREPTNAVIDVRTNNGRTRLFGQSDWNTLVGEGEHRIKLRTSNGSITVDKR